MEFILNTIFWTLALYGLYEIIKNIIYINTYTRFKSKGIYLIIGVKDQEEVIEGFLRSILFKILYGREDYFRNIIVADLESTDNTKEISKKLSKEYACLKVLSWKETRELMDNIDESWCRIEFVCLCDILWLYNIYIENRKSYDRIWV